LAGAAQNAAADAVKPKKSGFMSGLKSGLGSVGSGISKGVGSVGSGIGKGVDKMGSGISNVIGKNKLNELDASAMMNAPNVNDLGGSIVDA